jgi:hypothetical protein
MSLQIFDVIPFQLFNRKLAERKTQPVNNRLYEISRDLSQMKMHINQEVK